jgi:hypothetical protein
VRFFITPLLSVLVEERQYRDENKKANGSVGGAKKDMQNEYENRILEIKTLPGLKRPRQQSSDSEELEE